jgi:hypothetical protein
MKIKIKRKPQKVTEDTKKKSFLDKRIKLPYKIRLSIIGILFLFLIFSIFNVTAIEEEPKTTFKTDILFVYNQYGDFDYTFHLTDNTVYDGRKTIKPADNLIAFRNIVDHIDASFTYSFTSTEDSASISGEYTLTARIISDMWSKKFTLATGQFDNNFDEDFPIDYLYYENVTDRINTETGVPTTNPQLIIECNIYNLKIQSNQGTINVENFNPSITIPLNEKIIDISDTLRHSITGEKTKNEKITSSTSTKEENQWTSNSYIFIIIIIIFTLVTRGDAKKLNEIEKQVKKINKKFNEWIVEIDKTPNRPIGAELINMKSIEDLMKISEELGKPVIFHESEIDGTYSYYVLDETVHYKFVLYDKEKLIQHLVNDKEKYDKSF